MFEPRPSCCLSLWQPFVPSIQKEIFSMFCLFLKSSTTSFLFFFFFSLLQMSRFFLICQAIFSIACGNYFEYMVREIIFIVCNDSTSMTTFLYEIGCTWRLVLWFGLNNYFYDVICVSCRVVKTTRSAAGYVYLTFLHEHKLHNCRILGLIEPVWFLSRFQVLKFVIKFFKLHSFFPG